MHHYRKTRHPRRAQARSSRQTFETNIEVAKQTTTNAKQALRHCLHLLRKCKIKAFIRGIKRYGISLKRTSRDLSRWRLSVDSSKRSSLGNSLAGVTLLMNDDGISMLTLLSEGTNASKSTGETLVREVPVPLFSGKSDREMSSNFARESQGLEGTREERSSRIGKGSLKRSPVSKLFPPASFAPSNCTELWEGAGLAAQRRRLEGNNNPHPSIQRFAEVKPNSTSKIRANQPRDLPRSLQIGVKTDAQLDQEVAIIANTPTALDNSTQISENVVSREEPHTLQTSTKAAAQPDQQSLETSEPLDAPSQDSGYVTIGYKPPSLSTMSTTVSHLENRIPDPATLLNIPLQPPNCGESVQGSFAQDLNTSFDNVLARYADWESCPKIGPIERLVEPIGAAGSFESDMINAFDQLWT